MKVKEIPVSLFHSIHLSLLSAETLRKKKGNELPYIVSLTSIPSRLNSLHLVIRSLLNQDVRPEKIVLWLNTELKKKIPKKILQLQGEIFEIHFSDLYCSHRKLIHSLTLFPERTIVTCDDDLIYRKNWLSAFHAAHLKHPEFILANQTRYISYDDDQSLLPYKNWNYPNNNTSFNKQAILPIGAGGVLYPPNALHKKVTNVDLFMKLAPKADDLWFKAMALLQNTVAMQTENTPKYPIPIIGSQVQSLKKENIKKDKNREQWKALVAYFNINITKK